MGRFSAMDKCAALPAITGQATLSGQTSNEASAGLAMTRGVLANSAQCTPFCFGCNNISVCCN